MAWCRVHAFARVLGKGAALLGAQAAGSGCRGRAQPGAGAHARPGARAGVVQVVLDPRDPGGAARGPRHHDEHPGRQQRHGHPPERRARRHGHHPAHAVRPPPAPPPHAPLRLRPMLPARGPGRSDRDGALRARAPPPCSCRLAPGGSASPGLTACHSQAAVQRQSQTASERGAAHARARAGARAGRGRRAGPRGAGT